MASVMVGTMVGYLVMKLAGKSVEWTAAMSAAYLVMRMAEQ
jgi:hypothetical protein